LFENAEVVSKSYPDFWEDLKSLGFKNTPNSLKKTCFRSPFLDSPEASGG
jgi:hypothetical protein